MIARVPREPLLEADGSGHGHPAAAPLIPANQPAFERRDQLVGYLERCSFLRAPFTCADQPWQAVDVAAQLFALRGEATGEWHRVDATSSDVTLSDTARARIADALATGRIVVVPGKLGPDLEAAWWEIDPATGTTLGIGSRGWGASGPENVEVRTVSTAYVSSGANRIGWTVNCKILGAFLRTAGT